MTTEEMTIAALRNDREILRTALIKIVGVSEKHELEGMKVSLEAMRTLGLGEEKHVNVALVGVQALLDTI